MKVVCKLMGGLGNNLFQIVNLLRYSIKYNIPYCVPTKIDNPHYEGQKVFYSKYLNFCDEEYKGIRCFYNEKGFEYNEIPKQICDYCVLNGYFQSYHYFNDYREQILEILDIPYEFKEGYVAIHYRLGDYRKISNIHPPVSLEYIHSGIKYFTDRGYKKFICFSDEIDYCYENIKVPDDCTIGFSQGRTDIEDLSLASSCEHCICSNSSYSFWLYYLNQNEDKLGVFPKDNWFGVDMSHDTKDIYMPEMILL